MSTMSLFAWLAQHNYAGLLVEENVSSEPKASLPQSVRIVSAEN